MNTSEENIIIPLKHGFSFGKRLFRAVLISTTAFSFTACQHLNSKKSPKVLNTNKAETLADASLKNNVVRGPLTISQSEYEQQAAQNQNNIATAPPSVIGAVPSIAARSGGQLASSANGTAPRTKVKRIDAFVAPLPVPDFIDVVFGDMLKVPYITGPEVAQMTDIVQLRSSGEMRATDFQALVTKALEEYGVRIIPEDGAYKALQDSVLRARIPQFIKSRARPRTRQDLRPVVQFVEIRALNAGSVVGMLVEAFGSNSPKLRIKGNPAENYVTLSGLPENVDAAIAIIQEMDELNFADTQVRRFSPRYWSSKEMVESLSSALRTEGWQVSTTPGQARTITLLSVDYSNDVFVFAKTQTAHDRVRTWIQEFDRPVQGGDSEQIFVYQVQNVDATILAQTVNEVLGGGGSQALGTLRASTTESASTTRTVQPVNLGGKTTFTVDPIGNRLVFTGTANQNDKIISLLKQLDTPAPEVLIEVQIAEVTLTDNSSFGVDFFLDDLGNGDFSSTVQTGGLGRGSNGITVGFLTGNIDATLNAFASNRRVKVLSTPTLTARSGGSAEIQVGQDVPVITSQRAADNQTGTGPTDILQQIDYRETGVLMSIEPIVFSDNRIDLSISQEVSSAVSTANSTIASPTISNRTISTQLSLEDGQTAVLGGLIQENRIVDEQGVPILKDIPLIGQVFSVDGFTIERTELVVLITAYVLRGQSDRAQFVNYMSRRIDDLVTDESRLVTLLPKNF